MTTKRNNFRNRSRGVALALVLAVIGLAVVMGTAILATTTAQSQMKSNAVAAAEAQYLAESGAGLAIYYLQHPNNAPTLSGGVYPGETGISFGPTVSGTANVAVNKVSNNIYDISSSATVGGAGSNQVTRQVQVRVQINSKYVITDAASFAANFAIPPSTTITGNVRCDGILSIKAGGVTITGTIAAGGSTISGWTPLPNFPTRAAPSRDQLTLLSSLSETVPTYTYTDETGTHTGTPQALPATVTGTLSPNGNNPKNVWYADDDVTLGDCTVNGTIVVRTPGKKLIVAGAAQVTANSGMPAVIVSSSIQFASNADTKSLTVDGVCWTGGTIETTSGPASNCTLQVNGALMMAGNTASVSSDYSGSINLNYQSDKVQVPDLSSVDCTPQSVKILRWGI